MIITKVFGGLGNQMFQYAAGRALSSRVGSRLQVDVRSHHLEGASHNGYELERVFSVAPEQATDQSVADVLGWRRSRQVQRLLRKLKVRTGRYVVEPHFHHWSGFERLESPCYLDGYWQSTEYFSRIADVIASDFQFRQPLKGENARLAELIDSQPRAVSLHVRRGDYISNKSAAVHHGTCDLDYYHRATSRMAQELQGQPRYVVFSDDIDWARANLNLSPDAVFVGHNQGKDSHFDMQLMSRCRHHILANSSFSWWGAWLNRRAERTVLAPKRWFLAAHDTSTLTPADWIRL